MPSSPGVSHWLVLPRQKVGRMKAGCRLSSSRGNLCWQRSKEPRRTFSSLLASGSLHQPHLLRDAAARRPPGAASVAPNSPPSPAPEAPVAAREISAEFLLGSLRPPDRGRKRGESSCPASPSPAPRKAAAPGPPRPGTAQRPRRSLRAVPGRAGGGGGASAPRPLPAASAPYPSGCSWGRAARPGEEGWPAAGEGRGLRLGQAALPGGRAGRGGGEGAASNFLGGRTRCWPTAGSGFSAAVSRHPAAAPPPGHAD